MRKIGSISLSMNAIVVVVLAFVMLGLGLTIASKVGGIADRQLNNADAILDIGKKATSSDPITLQKLNIKRGDSTEELIGFYNAEDISLDNAIPQITKCIGDAGTVETDVNKLPIATTLPQAVQPSQGIGFSVKFKFKGTTAADSLSVGSYICEIAFCDLGPTAAGTCTPTNIKETKQITLTVSS
ncbi:MAG TPA: hypothetical protein VK158_02385 [Acidobacteriota bacterium]|nr:hypothetical protein [Acidobacteriota bacterium]